MTPEAYIEQHFGPGETITLARGKLAMHLKQYAALKTKPKKRKRKRSSTVCTITDGQGRVRRRFEDFD